MEKTEQGLVNTEQSSDIMPIEYLKQQTRQLEQLYKGLMKEGTDFGKVPGSAKPSLFKSGAELLRLRAKLDPHFTIDACGTDLEKGIFNYQVTCDLFRNGEHVGAGVGSCNSLESKYHYRWVFESALPKGVDKATLPSKRFQSKGRWYVTYKIENENPQDLANTILKMAKKRAFVDAILTVTGASRIFTQDIEDLVGDMAPTPSPTPVNSAPPPAETAPQAANEKTEEGSPIDLGWLKEQLTILQSRGLEAWTNKNIVMYCNSLTGKQAKSVVEAVKYLDKENVKRLVNNIEEAMAKEPALAS